MPQLSPLAVAALRHGDRVVFAGFALVLVAQTGAALTEPPERAEAQEVLAKVQKIATFMETGGSVAAATSPGWAEALRERLSPDRVREVDPAPVWLMHRRPKFIYQLAPKAEPPPWIHAVVTDVTATCTGPGRVAVRWTPAQTDLVVVALRLERRLRPTEEGAPGEWTLVAEPGPGVGAHEDAVPPRSRVEYRVVSTARPDLDNAAVVLAGRQGASLELPAELVRRESLASAPVEVSRDRFAVVRSTTLVPLQPQQGAAQLVVHVWSEKGPRFEPANLLVKVGDRLLTREKRDLGGLLEEVGEEPREVGGVPRRVAWARIRWDDGAVEEVTDRDAPPELKKP